MSTPSSIEISAERPVPVPTGDVESPSVDVECLTKELPSVEIHVELLGDSEDDDSEDGSNDEEVKKFITRVIKMTLAGEKQSEDPDLPQAEAENQQSEGGMSFLLMMIPSSDADTPDEDDSEKSIDPETTGVTTLNGTPQNAKRNKSCASESNEGCVAPPSTAILAGGF